MRAPTTKVTSARVRLCTLLIAASAFLAPGASSAQAQIGAVSFFGGQGTQGGLFDGFHGFGEGFRGVAGVAINQNGAGGGTAGDVYVIDALNSRIQQFSASGSFIRAFGLDVGGPGVDVCTVAPSCGEATASTAAGGLKAPRRIAIDQSNGNVYVSDDANSRIDVFSATGAFEGAFGWKVKVTGAAEELQFCTAASGCQAGSFGPAAGQLNNKSDNHASLAVSPLNGHIVVGDPGSRRVDEFAPVLEGGVVAGVSFVRGYGWGAKDGADEFQICAATCHAPKINCPFGCAESAPGQFGPGSPRDVAVNSGGKVYAAESSPNDRVQTFDPEGHYAGNFVEQLESRMIAINPANDRVVASVSCLAGEPLPPCPGPQLFDGNGNRFAEYDSAGNLLDTYLVGAVPPDAFDFDVATSSGTIYMTDMEDRGVITLGPIVPPTASIEPVTTFTGTTATFSGQVNPKGLFTDYRFEYSVDGLHWTKVPAEKPVRLPADSVDHAVSQEATGLEALTTYQVRLVATKLFNSGTATAETSFETSASPPLSLAPSTSAITDAGAKLEGFVNPENQESTYGFQCVTQSQFEGTGYAGATEFPSGGVTLAAGGEEVAVAQQAAGLESATVYRCRLAASNQAGAAIPAEVVFTTYAAQAAALSDGRAYEQATPVDKNGADANGFETLFKASPDGNAVTYFTTGGGSGGEGGQRFPAYVATRSSTGWRDQGLLPASSFGDRASVTGWSEDLAADFVVTSTSGSKGTLYRRENSTGAMEEIASGIDPVNPAVYAGESGGGAEVLFESKDALLPESIEGASNLYLWDRASGALSIVDILPDESVAPTGAFAGAYSWPILNSKSGGAGSGGFYTQDLHVLSSDGSKAFFTTSGVNQLYVRKGLGGPSPTTAQVSASQKTNGSGPGGKDPKGPRKAAFMQATTDGHYVFFTSQEELTNDATTGTADQGNDLYRYDTESGELIDIAPDLTDANGAEVQGVVGTSEDGSYVYFAANGVLAPGATPGACKSNPVVGFGGAGICNLYVWHQGTIEFIARDDGSSNTVVGSNWQPTNYSGRLLRTRASRVTPDGKTLLFASPLSLTPYDSEGRNEFYRYNSEEGLDCVSCNPTGATSVADATLQDIEPGFIKPDSPNPFLLHNLSADGTRAFFESPDKLVSSDTNGDTGCPTTPNGGRACQDVYMWEADGAGSCNSKAQNGGCIYLISTGESNEASYFADASADGSNAFFLTRQSLVRQDTDKLLDVYDARVGGGIASQNAPPPTRCEGEACKEGAVPPPGSESAGSATFSGPANPKATHKKPIHHKKRKHAKKKKHHSHKRQARSHR